MEKSYLLTAVTAAALGAGTVALTDLQDASATALKRKVTVSKSVPNNNQAITDIWSKVASALCADAEAKAGLSAGDCAVEPGAVVSFTRDATETHVSASFAFDGTWVKGSPQ